jgi:HEAT repeat protein/cyclophilin family peptidyl-prolyl cis-trans isomerase
MLAWRLRLVVAGLGTTVLAACASAPPAAAPERRAPMTFEQKMGWILRLEEDRILAMPAPPAPPPPVTPPPKGRLARVALPAPPPQPDLLILLKDTEARIRRRAALAVGRTRLPAGVPPLAELLASDTDPEVRQMAAFAIGLIGDASGAEPLVTALSDPDPVVHGRAAEGLGLIAHKTAANAIATMIQGHVAAGVLNGIEADDLEYPKPPPVEAVRLGIYALVRLGAYDQLAGVLLDTNGAPISRWWPVAYAFRRIPDPRGGTALLTLLEGTGAISRAFAARGLGVHKDRRAGAALIALVANNAEFVPVRIEAVRSLADLGEAEAVATLIKVLATPKTDANLRLEVVTALGQLRAPEAVEILVDLLTEPWPSIRATALTALARSDPDMFVTVISGLDPDSHWSVRAALATALVSVGLERAHPPLTAMLQDSDQRVIPAVLNALVALGAKDAEAALLERAESDDVVVRLTVANGLARLKSQRGVAALVQAYERADKDPTYIARAAVLGALVELDPEAAKPLLTRALGDRDWALRVRAAALLTKVEPGADLSSMRPAPAAPLTELNEMTPMIDPRVSPMAYIDTEKGLIQIELAVLDAPRTVTNFVSLARKNFWGGTPFHRIVPNFVVQDGDPRGDGEGGPGYTIRDEINQRPYLRGTVGMALDWEDTGGSQFFITHAPQPHLDGRYTVFGRVVAGLEVVDQLMQWDQIRTVRIWDGVNWIGPGAPD